MNNLQEVLNNICFKLMLRNRTIFWDKETKAYYLTKNNTLYKLQ